MINEILIYEDEIFNCLCVFFFKASSTNNGKPLYTTELQVLCRICGDRASGYHYGVHSCEGCKVKYLKYLPGARKLFDKENLNKGKAFFINFG
jgi:hypothetical protein